MRARIFESCFTTKPAGKGTGLGLAIAAQTMQASGGALTVASEQASFTRFSLMFPRIR